SLAAPHEKISYIYNITNAGTVTLSNITVHDSAVSDAVCSKPTLAPEEVFTCGDHFYLISQADIDTGTVENGATVTAIDALMVPVSADVIDKVPLKRTWSV
ncbi:unnamed protein product, partial [Sphacelaria rigidula]